MGENNLAVFMYDTNNGSYIRFGDGRWMRNKKSACSPINKLYYVPGDYKRELTRDNLRELDEKAIINTKEGGKLVEIISNNGEELIAEIGIVDSIEKVGL